MIQVSEKAVCDLAPNGELRAAINLGNPVLAQRASHISEPIGISVDLALELGRRLGVPVKLITFEAAARVVDAVGQNAWDVAFLAIDPKRACNIIFTEPYLLIEATYLVRSDSSFYTVEDIDKHGTRIAVGRGAAYDLFLSRTLKRAQLVRSDTSIGAMDLFRERGLEAAAGILKPLLNYARAHPECRVIDGRFAVIEQAVGTPAERLNGHHFLESFIEDLKTNGFIAEALERSGQNEARVAPSRVLHPLARDL